MRDQRIESLMVIGYNPSHSNINSEVNAPFKILSTLLRFLDSEYNPKKTKKVPQDNYDEEEKEGSGISPGYRMKRELLGEGERLDTYEGDEEGFDYGDEKPKGKQLEVEQIVTNLDDI